jgi:hypothetical protein
MSSRQETFRQEMKTLGATMISTTSEGISVKLHEINTVDGCELLRHLAIIGNLTIDHWI